MCKALGSTPSIGDSAPTPSSHFLNMQGELGFSLPLLLFMVMKGIRHWGDDGEYVFGPRRADSGLGGLGCLLD